MVRKTATRLVPSQMDMRRLRKPENMAWSFRCCFSISCWIFAHRRASSSSASVSTARLTTCASVPKSASDASGPPFSPPSSTPFELPMTFTSALATLAASFRASLDSPPPPSPPRSPGCRRFDSMTKLPALVTHEMSCMLANEKMVSMLMSDGTMKPYCRNVCSRIMTWPCMSAPSTCPPMTSSAAYLTGSDSSLPLRSPKIHTYRLPNTNRIIDSPKSSVETE
mmetsp:Transcript_1341/g.4229  ORF Transcript_1341/g.4229 Transcript_1341/m.4229 type:complete len:224 (-) Transcript_1341:845-1516(-)